MANTESSFKDEIKQSFQSALFGVAIWCVSDKVQNGLSDIGMVWDKFYAIELKFVRSLPKRDTSLLLSHPFSAKQIKYLLDVHNNSGGIGIGVIGLSNSDALLVTADEIVTHFDDGNITRGKAETLFSDPKRQMNKVGKAWNITKILDENSNWKLNNGEKVNG